MVWTAPSLCALGIILILDTSPPHDLYPSSSANAGSRVICKVKHKDVMVWVVDGYNVESLTGDQRFWTSFIIRFINHNHNVSLKKHGKKNQLCFE